jgi:hypothetical protein
VQVLTSWKKQDVKDAAAFSQKTRGLGVSRVVLGSVQVGTDILAAYCCSVTAAAFGSASSFGAEAIGFIFQLLFFYFATGAFLDLFRLGAVIGTAVGLGTNSKTLYAAIESLAGEASGLAVVDKAQAAVSSAKVVLALNSVRRIFKVRRLSFTHFCIPMASQAGNTVWLLPRRMHCGDPCRTAAPCGLPAQPHSSPVIEAGSIFTSCNRLYPNHFGAIVSSLDECAQCWKGLQPNVGCTTSDRPTSHI